ncbi:TPA_asm: hypothetical protein GZK45_14975 [Listeria innocua]|uniref:hypothetical protein n=1 Tax=Listeria monocytogenes TaxID=1639 RepID=UPI000930604E|nr:hypothetical protein [Listeria monocytogenes]HAC3177442.1 hypothetical protein [Listeria innocua]EAD4735612.1 hypothetical protein [Listeria monocytogenes]EAF0873523.1 hypothetical protein [Listeria monocytogenes]EAF2297159.1 hypothetical protein [Listeria monocytogenes]EAF2362798.1 hypothetical protein [Listeria monocytogenes]
MKHDERNYPLFNQEALNQFVEETGEYFTEDIEKAMHLWPNGQMTSSTYEGMRGDDHYVIASYFEHVEMEELGHMKKSEVLKVASAGIGVAMVVPETRMVLKAENQILTDKQIQVLSNNDFDLDYFSEGIILNDEKLRSYGVPEEKIKKLSDGNVSFSVADVLPNRLENVRENKEENDLSQEEYAKQYKEAVTKQVQGSLLNVTDVQKNVEMEKFEKGQKPADLHEIQLKGLNDLQTDFRFNNAERKHIHQLYQNLHEKRVQESPALKSANNLSKKNTTSIKR